MSTTILSTIDRPPQPVMELLPPGAVYDIPRISGNAPDDDTLVRAKLFIPGTAYAWYVLEYEDGRALVVVPSHPHRAAYVRTDRLDRPGESRVERDLWWWPVRLRLVRNAIELGSPL